MIEEKSISNLTTLVCPLCHKSYNSNVAQTFAKCDKCAGVPLFPRYNLSTFNKTSLVNRPTSMWRYFEVLPVADEKSIVSLGEGMTPILQLANLGQKYDFDYLYLKDESYNPTGTFKSRGMSAAVSKAKEFDIENLIIPTAGNAGGALSAYSAKANMNLVVVMPESASSIAKKECRMYGAEVIEIKGLIDKCGQYVKNFTKNNPRFFDMSTMKEPYRLEGKKTMGYEIAEQMKWELPDVILYPTGGGTGLVGMWKAFQEMIALGWIAPKLPRMIAVQSENCPPIINAFKGLKAPLKAKQSVAGGLSVPKSFAEQLILQILHVSRGNAIAITETEIIDSTRELAKEEGIWAAPEGGALLAALNKLKSMGEIQPQDRTLLLNTGSGYKYTDVL